MGGRFIKNFYYSRLVRGLWAAGFETESDFGGSVQVGDTDQGIFFQISLYPIVAPDGPATPSAVYIRDITEIRKSEARLKAALQEKEVLWREIHDRVKNNMQVISSLLNLQADRPDNQAAQALFREAHSRVTAMALIHEALYQSSSLAVIDFQEYLSGPAAGLFQKPPATTGWGCLRAWIGATRAPWA